MATTEDGSLVIQKGELKELVQQFADERDRRYMELFTTQTNMSGQRFADQAIAVAAAFAANEKAITAAFAAAEKATAAALAAAKEAVAKAEVAADKRFNSVNEFRAQLNDQAAHFLTRNEYSVQHVSLEDKLASAASAFDDKLTQIVKSIDDLKSVQFKIIGGLMFIGSCMPILAGIVIYMLTRGNYVP